MDTEELRELRHKYKAAYTAYLSCVQALSDASERGHWPPKTLVEQESAAFTDLALVRHALLESLREHADGSES